MSTFVLIHSPLCGPGAWLSTAHILRERGYAAIVPSLSDDEGDPTPLWRQQAASVAHALRSLPQEQPLIWVAHSGAGYRLPAYRAAMPNPATAYIFVDAGVPHDFPPEGLSQLDAMRREPDGFAGELQSLLEQGGRFPNWTDEMLRDAVPDAAARQLILRELKPRGARYYAEPVRAPPDWPDAPCAYLLFNEASYGVDAGFARASGWPMKHLPSGHFHMLLDPQAVATALIELLWRQ